jgi:hypothetical protein
MRFMSSEKPPRHDENGTRIDAASVGQAEMTVALDRILAPIYSYILHRPSYDWKCQSKKIYQNVE